MVFLVDVETYLDSTYVKGGLSGFYTPQPPKHDGEFILYDAFRR